MRKSTFTATWAGSVLCSLALQHFAFSQAIDAWSILLFVAVTGLTLAGMEWVRREYALAKAERAEMLAEMQVIRRGVSDAIDGQALRVTVSER